MMVVVPLTTTDDGRWIAVYRFPVAVSEWTAVVGDKAVFIDYEEAPPQRAEKANG
jgi:hypothetical protein